MKVLVVAPHPDDEALGVGGTIIRHVEHGDEVSTLYMTSGNKGLPDLTEEETMALREVEAVEASKLLGTTVLPFLRFPDGELESVIGTWKAIAVREILDRYSPSIIYTANPWESHADHRAATRMLHYELEQIDNYHPAVRFYEVWTPLRRYNIQSDVTDVMERKMQAVRAHRSQVEREKFDEAIEGLNRYRGELSGKRWRFAEVFLEEGRPLE